MPGHSGMAASSASFLVDAYRWLPWLIRRTQNIRLASVQVEPRRAVFGKHVKNVRELARRLVPLAHTVSLKSVSELLIQQCYLRVRFLLAAPQLDNTHSCRLSR